MIDTIDKEVLRRAADTLVDNLPPGDDVVVHTITITLNGAHGGVDVIADMFADEGPDHRYSWRST